MTTITKTSLVNAIKENNLDLARQLIEKGIHKGKWNTSPLIRAIMGQNSDIVDLLIKAGVDVNADPYCIYNAIKIENVDILQKLIDAGINVNEDVDNLTTPLRHAIDLKNPYIVQQLIDAGASVDAEFQDSTYKPKTTALSLAVCYNEKVIIKKLITAGADPNRCNPLCDAAKQGLDDVVDQLIIAGANLNKTNEQQNSPLALAAGFGKRTTVKKLLDAGALPSPYDIQFAQAQGQNELSDLLIRHLFLKGNCPNKRFKIDAKTYSYEGEPTKDLIIKVAVDKELEEKMAPGARWRQGRSNY